jgi:geranyl-CoA carboxylase alpha subunit
MLAALRETVLLGVVTNRDYLAAVLAHPAFAAGSTHTEFLAEHLAGWTPTAAKRHRDTAAVLAALALSAPVARRDGAGTADAALATPWETLGSWRPGAGAR